MSSNNGGRFSAPALVVPDGPSLDGVTQALVEAVQDGGLSLNIGFGPFDTGTALAIAIDGLVGGEAVSYRWFYETTAITGATSAGYTATIGTDGVSEGDLIRGEATVDGLVLPLSSPRQILHPAPVAAGGLADVQIDAGDTNLIATAGDFTFNGTPTYDITTGPAEASINANTGELDLSQVGRFDGPIVIRATDVLNSNRFDETAFNLDVRTVPAQMPDDWSVVATGPNTVQITIPSAPDDGGASIGAWQISVASATGGFTALLPGGGSLGTYNYTDATRFPAGTTPDVWMRPVNSVGEGLARGPKSVTMPTASITISDEPSTAGIGSIIAGETHSEVIARMTDPAGGDTANAAEASTTGAGNVSRTVSVTGGSDPFVAGQSAEITVQYAAAGGTALPPYVLDLGAVAAAASAPDAFAVGGWSVAANNLSGGLDVTLTTIPADNGNAITAVEYRLDGGTWTDLGGTTTGTYPIASLTNGTAYAVELRAVNSEGASAASDSKSATPSTVPEAFTAGEWSIADLGTGGDAQITLSALPDNGGMPVQIVQYSLDGGSWQGISGSNATGVYTLTDVFTDGVATDVEIRAVNANGPGSASDTKSITTTPAVTVPSAFANGDWAVADLGTTGDARVTITALPTDGGASITGIEYRLDGGSWTSSGGTTTFDIAGLTDDTATDVELRAVNSVGSSAASDTKSVTTTAPSVSITITDATYTEGGTGGTGAGLGPALATTISEIGGSPDYTLFWATHASGTTLSKTDIETGSGDAVDRFSFIASTIEGLDTAIALATSLTGGKLSLFVRDDAGSPIESPVYEITGVNVDATAPILSSVVGSSTGENSVSWGVTSNEAMGTTYAGIRLATDAALTAAQLIAGSGGTGIAFDNDELSADNGNNGDFSGLTEGTGYVIDTVAVDDWGNVSNVVSSATVTTDAAPVAGDIAPFVEQHAFSGASGTNGVYTISGVTLGTSGEVYIGYAASHPGQSGDPSSFTVGGVAATEVAKNIAQSRLTTAVYKVSPSSATGDVVINVGANLSDGGAIYVWKADTALTTTATATAIEPETNPTPPVDLDVSVNVAANGKVLVVGASVGGSGTVWDRASGVTEITGAQIDTDSGDHVNAWEASELSAETPRTVSVGFGLENPTFISAAAISLETL